jgi:hypothetical protein
MQEGLPAHIMVVLDESVLTKVIGRKKKVENDSSLPDLCRSCRAVLRH